MNEWISVNDRLPEKGVRVLTVQEDGFIRINMVVRNEEFGSICSAIGKYKGKYVKTLYWMPFPDLPKELEDV